MSVRCRATEAIAVIQTAVRDQGHRPRRAHARHGQRIGAHCAATRLALPGLGIAHRRDDYGDRESQAFIESWFRYLKQRCVCRNEFETLDQARGVIAAYSLRGEGSTGLLATPDPIDRQRAKIRF